MATYVIIGLALIVLGMLLRGALRSKPSFGVEAARGALDVADGMPAQDRPGAVRAMRGFATRVLGYEDSLEAEVASSVDALNGASAKLVRKNDRDGDKVARIRGRIAGRDTVILGKVAEASSLLGLADALK